MRRVRWLDAKWPISLKVLASRLKKRSFTEGSFDGYFIHRVRENSIEGEYIEKLNYLETVLDPFGREIIVENVRYRKIDFTLFSEFPCIELRDAHRSTREFINNLSELCNFSLIIKPITLDVLRCANDLQRSLEGKSIIDSIQVSELEFQHGIFAKILLKGDNDVLTALENISQGKKFRIENIQIKAQLAQKIFPIHISDTCSAKIPDEHWNELLPLFRSALTLQKPQN